MIGQEAAYQQDAVPGGVRAVHPPLQASATQSQTKAVIPNSALPNPKRDAPSDNHDVNSDLDKRPKPDDNAPPAPVRKDVTMTEAPATKSAGDAAAGIPFYEKQRAHLKDLINRKRMLEKRLAAQEDNIYQKETEYLENTPAGNIITGFDNYTKGTGNAAAARRKTGLSEQNRVFSRSSISYNPNSESQTPASTPGSLAPTPLSTSFGGANKDGANSGAPTPTSATGSGKAGGASKKKRSAAAAAVQAADKGVEDSDEGQGNKKVRTNFGAVRR